MTTDTKDHPHATALHSLAKAVLDLADGTLGDDQEWDRAQQIADRLYDLADGLPVAPIDEHNAARERWFAVKERDKQLLIKSLPYPIDNHLRYSHNPDLHLDEHSTRADVRRVRHLLPLVRGIGAKSLTVIDEWLCR